MAQAEDYLGEQRRMNQRALVDQMGAPGMIAPTENRGQLEVAGQPAAQPAPSYANKLEGFDQGKLASGHDSPKYQFARVAQKYDPKGGITQQMIDELNGLGIGTVNAKVGGDKIAFGGNVDPRFEGVTEFDVIRDLENGGGWQWGGLNGPAAQQVAPPPQMFGVRSGAPTDSAFFQKLMEQARGQLGAPAIDQNALLALMQR